MVTITVSVVVRSDCVEICSFHSHSNRNMYVIPCINNSHCSLYGCGVTSTGAISLGEGLQGNNSLEELVYVERYSHSIHCRYCSARLADINLLRATIIDGHNFPTVIGVSMSEPHIDE